MNVVRLHGDPFARDVAGAQLRALLRLALESRMTVGLCLTCADLDRRDGGRVVELTNGARAFAIRTSLEDAAIADIRAAASTALPSTAPVLVFAPPDEMRDNALMASLEWPSACAILRVSPDSSARDLMARVRGELRWAGREDPEFALDLRELEPWLALPRPEGSRILHVCSDREADGTDVLLEALSERLAAGLAALRIVTAGGEDPSALADLARRSLRRGSRGDSTIGDAIEFVDGPLSPSMMRDVSIVVEPVRVLSDPAAIVKLLASGRPLCLSRFAATARLVPGPSLCEPIGGIILPAKRGRLSRFEPDRRALLRAVELLSDPGRASSTAARARAHVIAEFVRDRPAPLVPARARAEGRPKLVLEAPFLEVSSSAEFSIETARALLRRGLVDLRLVPTVPFRRDLSCLRARAPELLSLLGPPIAGADLWLSSGWPVRTARPDARLFALRFDWEYGAIPLEVAPVVANEADLVVVHSTHVLRSVTAAGRPASQVRLIPHGVDGGVFHPGAEPLRRVAEFKGADPAVLFVGGLIWRKGIDLFLRALLDAFRSGARFCAVIKACGGNDHYGGQNLVDLVKKVQAHAGAPRILLIEDDLSREQVAGLMRACDLLLHPYRGEGFCMPALEARAVGLPVLLTAGGATDDFAAGESAVRLPSSRRNIGLPIACAGHPWVIEPDPEQLGPILARSLAGLEELASAARREAMAVIQECTWDAAASEIERLACAATARRAAPPSPIIRPPRETATDPTSGCSRADAPVAL